MLPSAGACDEGDLVAAALRLRRRAAGRPASAFEHVLIDDAQELDLAPGDGWRWPSAGRRLTAAGDPLAALRRFRGAGAARLDAFETRGHAGRAVARS